MSLGESQIQRLRVWVLCLLIFLHNPNDSKELLWSVNQAAVGNKAIYKMSHCVLQSADPLERTFSQDKEARIIDIFPTSSQRRAGYEETSQRRIYYLLMISCFPDKTMYTCNACVHETWKVLGDRFCFRTPIQVHLFAGLPYKVLWRKSLCKMHHVTDLDGQRFVI